MADPKQEPYREGTPRPVARMDRRDVLRMLAGGTLLLSTGGVLVGCGGSASNTPSGNGTLQNFTGTVNTQEIGGTGLTVQSALKSSSPVSAANNFTTLVSKQGAQLLSLADATGKIRALTISLPGTRGQFDAVSTAATVVFLTPGIVSSTLSEASARLSQIKALPSFAALTTFLQQHLPTTALSDISQDTTLDSLKTSCINDWLTSQGRSIASVLSHPHDVADATLAQFSAKFGQDTSQGISLANGAWRYVSVVRQELDAQSNQLGQFQQPSFPPNYALLSGDSLLLGATPYTWGSIFTKTAGSAGTATDEVNLSSPANIASVTYWAYGIGLPALSDPNAIDASNFERVSAVFHTVFYYIVAPILDVVVGRLGILSKIGHTVLEEAATFTGFAWGIIGGRINISQLVTAVINGFESGHFSAVISTLIDLTIAIFGVLSIVLAALGIATLTTEVIADIVLAATAFTACFSAGNFLLAVSDWLLLPEITSVNLPISGATVTVQ